MKQQAPRHLFAVEAKEPIHGHAATASLWSREKLLVTAAVGMAGERSGEILEKHHFDLVILDHHACRPRVPDDASAAAITTSPSDVPISCSCKR